MTKERRLLVITALLALAFTIPASVSAQDSPRTKPAVASSTEPEGHSIAHKAVFYIPNRLFDILDIFRARVRIGPGMAIGVRASKVAQVFLGTYVSVFAGIPGPRMSPIPKLPVGLESRNGIDVSVVEASVSGGMNPGYSPTEVGCGVQVAVIGADVGIDPVEIVDFVVGIVGLDLRDDDL